MKLNMKFSLFNRLVLVFLVTFGLVLWLFFYWSAYLESSVRLEAEQRLHLDLATHLAQDNPLLQEGKFAYEDLSNLFHTLMMLGPNFEFYFVDSQGKILAFSADPGKVVRESVDLSPLQALQQGKASLPLLGDDPRSASGQKIFSVAPVSSNGQLQGYLYVIIGSEKAATLLTSLKDNQQRWQHFLMFATVLLFVALTMVWVFYFVTRPVAQLAKVVSELKDKDQSLDLMQPWLKHSHHEVHQLGTSFAYLLQQNQQQLRLLEEVDLSRREMLAGLSHDLRTPLASLQGYVDVLTVRAETEQMSAAEQAELNQYLGIIKRNAHQLKLLIDQVFELAYLEGGQVNVSQEPLLLLEFLHDIRAKMQVVAMQEGVNIHVAGLAEDVLINTDVAKLERVLTNLIENAIRHTPAGGEVILGVDLITDGSVLQVALKVTDTGSGIPESELPYIFNARYRGITVTPAERYRAGLGLTVCKKLAQLLGTDIKVHSEQGKGAQFMLQLPLQAT